MRDQGWRSHPLSHRGKRREALIEVSTPPSVLFRPVFHLLARPLACGSVVTSGNRGAVAINWGKSHFNYRPPFPINTVSTSVELLQPHPEPSFLPVDQQIGALLSLQRGVDQWPSAKHVPMNIWFWLDYLLAPINMACIIEHVTAPPGVSAPLPEEPSCTCGVGDVGDSRAILFFSSGPVLLSARFYLLPLILAQIKAAARWNQLLKWLNSTVENGGGRHPTRVHVRRSRNLDAVSQWFHSICCIALTLMPGDISQFSKK